MKTRRLVNGDITFGRGLQGYVSGAEAVAQKVLCRLRVIAKEWCLDQSQGVPYFPLDTSGDKTFVQMPADVPFLEASFKATILQTDGVQNIISFASSFDHASRRVTVDASGSTLDGGTWQITFSTGDDMPTTVLNWTQNYHKLISVDSDDAPQSLLELDLSDCPLSCTKLDVEALLIRAGDAAGGLVGEVWINGACAEPESFNLALGTATTQWQGVKFSLALDGPSGSGVGLYLMDSSAGFSADFTQAIASPLSLTDRMTQLQFYTSVSGGGLSPAAVMAPGSYLSVVAR
jgi:hypothetical protein